MTIQDAIISLVDQQTFIRCTANTLRDIAAREHNLDTADIFNSYAVQMEMHHDRLQSIEQIISRAVPQEPLSACRQEGGTGTGNRQTCPAC